MVAIPESERADFEDLLGSGGLFRKTLRANADGAQAGAPAACVAVCLCAGRKFCRWI